MANGSTQSATTGKPIKTAGVEVTLPDISREQEAAQKALARYGDLEIDCNEVYVHVDSELTIVKTKLKQTTDLVARLQKPFETIRKEAVSGKNQVSNEFASYILYLQQAEVILKRKQIAYVDEQERIRLAEEKKLREEQEVAERKRRQEAEQKAREESERRAEEARRLEAEARRVQKKDAEAAQKLREQAEQTIVDGQIAVDEIMEELETEAPSVAIVNTSVPKMAGTAVKRSWVPRLKNLKKMLQGIIEGKIPEAVIEVKMQWFRTEATRLGPEFDYPGVESTQETNIAKTV